MVGVLILAPALLISICIVFGNSHAVAKGPHNAVYHANEFNLVSPCRLHTTFHAVVVAVQAAAAAAAAAARAAIVGVCS